MQIALELRDTALAKVHAGAPERWKAEAWRVLKALAESREEFTTDDIWRRLQHPPEPRAIGALVMSYRRANRIKKVGYRPSERPVCHARPIAVWKGI